MTDDDRMRRLLNKVTVELRQARAQLAARPEDPGREPVAIVAASCRYPGGADSPEALWDLVAQGRDATGDFPTDRHWDIEGLHAEDPGTRGGITTRRGGFLADVAGFDADLFGISPREALAMDPQQRLLLELTWEALERAGIAPDGLRGERVGVYTGISATEYGARHAGVPHDLEGHLGTGKAGSVVSGRLSFAYGFEGPSLTVDTACSSSLVALHLATRALRAGECRLAVAAGVAVIAEPAVFVEFSRQRGLAPDGRCKAFSAAADGAGFSEGAGVLLLAPLSEARRAGLPVLGLVRGSAVNSDGASSGLTTPNGPAQQRVIRAALADAGLRPSDVDLVEAHGTGTRLGDPIEARALLATYGQDRDTPVWLGSVKSNLGHAQGAAGMAGVIKALGALRHGALPRTLHADTPTPEVDWTAGRVELLAQARPWPAGPGPRRAAVSGFGMSGTNAHVVLEAAPEPEPQPEPEPAPVSPPVAAGDPTGGPTPPAVPWLLSAPNPPALLAQARTLADFLTAHPELRPADVGLTLATRRALLPHRVVVTGGLDELRSLPADAGEHGHGGGIAFTFTGQGAQHPGMGRELRAAHPRYAEAFDEVCAELDRHLGAATPLADLVLTGVDDGRLDDTGHAQAALFAVEVALFRLLESWGVRPDVLIGHSVGELAAAHVAGVWDLPDACRVVAARARLMAALPPGGAMVAVAAPEAEVSVEVAGTAVSVAAVNGPAAVVISGEATEVRALAARWAGRGTRTRELRVSHAFHSALVEPVLDEFRAVVAGTTAREPSIPVLSNRTAAPLTADQVASPDYWADHARGTVRFADCVAAAERGGTTTFVELGPGGVLSAMVTDTLRRPGGAAIALLRHDTPETRSVAAGVGRLVTRGHDVTLTPLFTDLGATPVELPTYSFQHTPYWLGAPAAATGAAALGQDTTGHPLAGAAVDLPDGGVLLTGRLSRADQPWLADHRVLDRVLVPGTALVDLAVRAGDELGASTLEEFVVHRPLELPDRGAVRIRVVATPGEPATVSVLARPDHPCGTWTEHASGTLTDGHAEPDPLTDWPPSGGRALSTGDVYTSLRAVGVDYGPGFRGLRAAWRRDDVVFAEVTLPAPAEPDGFAVHPALLDAALHTLRLTGFLPADAAFVPFSFAGVRVHATGARTLRVRVTHLGGQAVRLVLADAGGAPVAEIAALTVRRLGGDPTTRDPAVLDHLLRPGWTPTSGTEEDPARWAPLGEDRFGLGPGEGTDAQVRIWSPPTGDVRTATTAALTTLRDWLATDDGTRLLVLTTGAVSTAPGEDVPDLAAAAVHGLVRSAQSEHPGRLVLVDVDTTTATTRDLPGALRRALATGEPQIAVREGRPLAARLTRFTSDGVLAPPPGEPAWRLGTSGTGTVENLRIDPCPDVLDTPLPAGRVRIDVRAAGVNFRDVFTVLGLFPSVTGLLGGEAAGVVREVGPGVTDLRPGDPVTGLVFGGFGPVAVADRRLLTRFPDGWTFEQAAGMPLVFLTAYHALVDLADLAPGESVLVHAAAGGVGMAATQLAHHLGATVLGTAHPRKWDALRGNGIAEERIASSRTLEFEDAFADGVDVVLNSLSGEFVDASLRLLRPGGRFLEMGKVDIRDDATIARDHPGVRYRDFDVLDAGPDHIQRMFTALLDLFDRGALAPLPVTTWDVHRAREAFRHVREGHHTGKVVLTLPRRPDPDGTVLVTGGTGDLGGLLARHLVDAHGVRHLLLLSRRGPDAPGAAALTEDLTSAGARVRVLACDVGDRDALAEAIASVPADHPLTGVVHTAAVVDDAVIGSLTPDQLDRVLRPKADAALHLHELTSDLALFALFSSAAGVLGGPGQGNYAAANAVLDGLAAHRHAHGLPATSLAWGLWEQDRGITAGLSATDRARMRRDGLLPLGRSEGLDLFDHAVTTAEPRCLPLRLDLATVAGRPVPPPLARLVRPTRRAASEGDTAPAALADRLAALPTARAGAAVLDVVREHTASVLGHGETTDIRPDQGFGDLGFDSLTAVELRNRLVRATGVRLTATAVFDHPTPEALADHLLDTLRPPTADPGTATPPTEDAESELDSLDPDELIRRALAGAGD
ncbi:type I polyketide synthase [Actinoalloteichus caeruleus]|uniref:type I polyketide synthase n=3 Tax=Actinoalloteichus cyanogriseus TaxID=2893586 RepID=UPI00068EDF7F|nr:type I polyketide synthase [Actinoalloteichus caeruleus]